ncbi:MAG: hypothetical protein U9N76_04725, partial [Candidatus Marinimicrobia bacterium]|nr:hypothetical protein [Candidatus Neomarinimicrobiota bacterium]
NPEGLGEFVTFTHLPEKANIKIYNLAGIHITTLEHNDATSQFKEWDLTNGQNWLVASGMYIAYIELPDLDMHKILKFMVIQRKWSY